MSRLLACLLLAIGLATAAAQPAQTTKSKIKPGEVIVPVGKGEQRLMLGELLSVDLKTRTGKFRVEGNDKVFPFTVLPYAELQFHNAPGDLQDYRPGQRVLVRLHEDEKGEWTWLTCILDEVSFLAVHMSYYWVDAVDPATGKISYSRADAKKTHVGEMGTLETDNTTRFWKDGKPASFKDIKVGEKIRANTHETGKGKVQICWDVFLDDDSVKKVQAEQKAVHLKRLEKEGLAAYVDSRDGKAVRLTFFHENLDVCKDLKAGQTVRLAPAGVDRKPTAKPVTGKVTEVKAVKKVYKVAVTLDAESDAVAPLALFRVWVER